MAIRVQCRNKLCPAYAEPRDFPANLVMALGEQIICGECGADTRFIGNDRPLRNKPWEPGMNQSFRILPFEDGTDDLPEQLPEE